MLPCSSKRLEDRGSLPAEPNATPPQSWRFFSPMRLVFSCHSISRSDMAVPDAQGMHASRPTACVAGVAGRMSFERPILVSSFSYKRSASLNSHCPWGLHLLTCRPSTSNQYPRLPICRISKQHLLLFFSSPAGPTTPLPKRPKDRPLVFSKSLPSIIPRR